MTVGARAGHSGYVVPSVAFRFRADGMSTTPGSTSTTIPSGIAVAVFATIGTWVVAKYAFGRRGTEQ